MSPCRIQESEGDKNLFLNARRVTTHHPIKNLSRPVRYKLLRIKILLLPAFYERYFCCHQHEELTIRGNLVGFSIYAMDSLSRIRCLPAYSTLRLHRIPASSRFPTASFTRTSPFVSVLRAGPPSGYHFSPSSLA